jgi:hypothetical protein
MAKPSNESPLAEREGGTPPSDQPQAQPESAKAQNAATPAQHAIATGNVEDVAESVRVGGRPDRKPAYSMAHKCADRLHGWALHEYHEAEPIKITREAYEAALKAAMQPVTRLVVDGKKGVPLSAEQAAEHTNSRAPGKKGELITDYEPHHGALSKHSHLFKASA